MSYRKIETFGRPVVALLTGSALGGGWEVALAAHARFALDDASLRFGMPEVTLGLIPGATGITKRCAFRPAGGATLSARRQTFGPREAHRDRLGRRPRRHRPRDLRAQAHRLDRRPPRRAAAVGPASDYRMPGGTPGTPKIAAMLSVAPAVLLQKTRGLYPAPQAILEAMVEAPGSISAGARIEAESSPMSWSARPPRT